MTTQTTQDTRTGLMQALATAEQIAARVQHIPTDIKVTCHYRGDFTLDLFFYRGPANVCSFAHEFGGKVETSPRDGGEKTCTEAHATVDGIAVRAWSLDATATLEGLRAEQDHQLKDEPEPPLYVSAHVSSHAPPAVALAGPAASAEAVTA